MTVFERVSEVILLDGTVHLSKDELRAFLVEIGYWDDWQYVNTAINNDFPVPVDDADCEELARLRNGRFLKLVGNNAHSEAFEAARQNFLDTSRKYIYDEPSETVKEPV